MKGLNMKLTTTNLTRLNLLCLTACAVAITATPLTAQVFSVLHEFAGVPTDGANPGCQLVLVGNTLYGTAQCGGNAYAGTPWGYGTVFKVNTDGTGYRTLYKITTQSFGNPLGLLLSGVTLYVAADGAGPVGGLFAVNTNGTGVRTLHVFSPMSGPNYTNSDGALYWGQGQLTLSGTIFALNTNGTGFTILHHFAPTSGSYTPGQFSTFVPPYTNSDGAFPFCGLLLSGDTLYGTTGAGGSSGWGTVFAINTNGTGFTNLHYFTGSDGGSPGIYGTLVLSGNTLYGGVGSGSAGSGTVFAINTDGTGFRTLYSFTAASGANATNSDGVGPCGLILSGNTLYGGTWGGGAWGNGTVFALNTDGTGFATLYSFTATSGAAYTNNDGASVVEPLVLSGNTLYGTTLGGGSTGGGTVFSLSFRPRLTIVPGGANVLLTWPTNYAGFDYTLYRVQWTTNLGSSAVWNTNCAAPVVVGHNNVVTCPSSGSQQFFRLSQ